MSERRTLIIGIDGAAHPLVRAWTENGKLGTLARFVKNGAFGKLRSTVPPITYPAIPSFLTGKNPGKHGVAAFFRPRKDRSLGLITSDNLDGEFWNIGGMREKRKLIVNFPLTFPAKPLNGNLISGFMTPDKGAKGFMYPDGLRSKIEKLLKAYDVDVEPEFTQQREKVFVEGCSEATGKQVELMKHLLAKERWELGMVYFTMLDRIQHHVFSKKGTGWTARAYRMMDTHIGELLKDVDDDVNVFIFSDHGFGRSVGRFYPNAWLSEKGLLHLKGGKKRSGIGGKVRGLQFSGAARSVARLMPKFIFKRGLRFIESVSGAYDFDSIDWDRTKAYATISGIYVNPKLKKERKKIVDRVVKDLATVEGLRSKVWRREDVYSGDKVGELPDVIYSIEGYSYEPFASFDSNVAVQSLSRGSKGWHREEGILMAKGRDIGKGRLRGADIMDIAPTVMHLMGCAVSSDMDGKVLYPIFGEGSDAKDRMVRRLDGEEMRVKDRIGELKRRGRL